MVSYVRTVTVVLRTYGVFAIEKFSQHSCYSSNVRAASATAAAAVAALTNSDPCQQPDRVPTRVKIGPLTRTRGSTPAASVLSCRKDYVSRQDYVRGQLCIDMDVIVKLAALS